MYDDKTIDELKELLTERDKLIEELGKESGDYKFNSEAEIESLKKELEEVKELNTQTMDELKRTKELNFTLGRQVAGTKQNTDVESILHDIFGKKER